VARAGALLRGAGPAGHDFFRDRTEEDRVGTRLLVIGDDGSADDPALGDRSGAQIQLDEVAARRAARALHELAAELGLRSSTVDVPDGPPLVRFAAAAAFGEFTAAYLAFGLGLDPGAARPAELTH
jgi:glucose/mannose-6-phosphate isomerase